MVASIAKYSKTVASKIQSAYKASKSFQIATKIAGIFAIAGIESKSSAYWEKRRQMKNRLADRSIEDLDAMIRERKLELRDLKRYRSDKKWNR